MSVLFVHDQKRDAGQVSPYQLITQVSQLSSLREAEVSASFQQRYHHHVSQQLVHGRIAIDVPERCELTDG